LLIGITGNIGSGKTTFSNILKSLGFKVVNGDTLAKGFLKKGTPTYFKVVEMFGRDVLTLKGEIDTRALSQIVFSSEKELKKLTSIIHPPLKEEIKKLAAEPEIVFFEAAVIVEYGWQNLFDKLITVYAHKGQRLLRASKKFGIKEVLKREMFQLPYKEKLKYTDYLICNTRHVLHLKEQAEELVKHLMELKK